MIFEHPRVRNWKKHLVIYQYKRRTVFGLSLLLLLMIYFFKNASFILRAVSTAGLLIFFYVLDHSFDIRFRGKHYLFILVIAIFTLLLSPFYHLYPHYDKVQHFFLPLLISSIIFYMVSHLRIELKWKLTFTFFITIGILGLFELGEYALDYFFDLKLQGVYLRDLQGLEKFNLIVDRIDDTMIDLFLGILGSSLYALVFGIAKRKEIFPKYS